MSVEEVGDSLEIHHAVSLKEGDQRWGWPKLKKLVTASVTGPSGARGEELGPWWHSWGGRRQGIVEWICATSASASGGQEWICTMMLCRWGAHGGSDPKTLPEIML
jgi:hypothetical protein